MKEIIGHLRGFVAGYSPGQWLLVCLFCALSVVINYTFGVQEKIDRLEGFEEFTAYLLLYGVHVYTSYLLTGIFAKDFTFFHSGIFHILLISAIFIFSFRAAFWYHRELVEELSNVGFKRINRTVYNDAFRFLYTTLPVLLIWFFFQRKKMPLYGFRGTHLSWKVYIYMLLIMIPLIAAASFMKDFLDYYPRVRRLVRWDAPIEKLILFELLYGLDFFSIEFFFRGFMVLAFIPFAGKHAIIPMAVFYLSIHYGKPAGEAISSFFGGLLLGVVSYRSKNISGGIFVHVGIAWMMETGAFFGNIIRGSWP